MQTPHREGLWDPSEQGRWTSGPGRAAARGAVSPRRKGPFTPRSHGPMLVCLPATQCKVGKVRGNTVRRATEPSEPDPKIEQRLEDLERRIQNTRDDP